jgi:hypothetical protein
MPILTISFVLNYIDRTNIGFAALTMNRDLGLSATQFGFGAGILFLSYCLFEVPSNLLLFRVGARRWLARIMISWGLVTVATIFVTGPASFYALRLLLGIAEAGFVPGAMFYLSTWIPSHYRSRILAWFQLAVPLASLLSGPLSGYIFKLDGFLGLASWQWIFVCEGIPSAAIGVALLFVLPDNPGTARWLTALEREVVTRHIRGEVRRREVHGLGGLRTISVWLHRNDTVGELRRQDRGADRQSCINLPCCHDWSRDFNRNRFAQRLVRRHVRGARRNHFRTWNLLVNSASISIWHRGSWRPRPYQLTGHDGGIFRTSPYGMVETTNGFLHPRPSHDGLTHPAFGRLGVGCTPTATERTCGRNCQSILRLL